jgi:hypothetical protein
VKAPRTFLSIIERKLSYQGEAIRFADTWKVKASQYDHNSDIYIKKRLSEEKFVGKSLTERVRSCQYPSADL